MSRRHPEAGASLMLVIVLVFVIGLVASATLSFAGTSIRASSAYGERADVKYDVDGALQAAINQLRNSAYVAVDQSGKPVLCPDLTVPGVTGDVLVTCEPKPGSGATGGGRMPQHALFATGMGAHSGETGIANTGTEILRVVGNVHSQSNITTTSPIEVDGTATAVLGCTGDVRSDATNCKAPPGAAQSIPQPISDFTPRAVPTCPGNGTTIRFQPGFYYDAVALSNLMNTCTGSTFWFPGAAGGAKYYFDFHNGEVGSTGGEPEWTVTNPAVRIVGGGTKPPGAPGTVTIPGSCTSPVQRSDNAGVQFVFGGRSRLRMTAGQVELCGPGDAAGNAPPVAIFGGETTLGAGVSKKAGGLTPPSGNVPGILKMEPGTGTNPPAGCSNSTKIECFDNKDRIADWGTSTADSDFSSTGQFPSNQNLANQGGWRAIVNFSGYDPADANPPKVIPAGATLVWANLYVRHRERRRSGDPAIPAEYIHVTVRPSRAGAPAVGPGNTPGQFTAGIGTYDSTTPGVDTVDLLGGDPANSALQQEVTQHGLSGFDLQWLVAAKTGRRMTADLDSIQIAVGWVTPNGFVDESTGKNTPPNSAEADQPGILKSNAWPAPSNPSCGSSNQVECFDNTDRIAEWGTDGASSNFAETGAFPTTLQSLIPGWRAIVNANGYAPSAATPEPSRPAWINAPTIVPPGSVLSYAKLYVRHRELRQGGGSSSATEYIHVSVTPARSGAPQVGPANPPGGFTPGLSTYDTSNPGPGQTDTVDLMATPALANEVREYGLTGFNVQWTVGVKLLRRLNAGLDSIQIALGWTTPADFRSQDAAIPGGNCVGAPTAPYSQPGSCALVRTSSDNGQAKFHVQGTGYARRAVFDLRHRNVAAPVFNAGLIARAVALGLTWAPGYNGVAISGKAQPLKVLFRAYTCSGGTCPTVADRELAGTAMVQFTDAQSPPQAGKRAVKVESWTLDP